MKTKTILRLLSVFFTLTLFFTSCTTEEVTIDETESNIVNTDENSYSRGAPSVLEVHIGFYPETTQQQMDAIRANYSVVAGLILFDVIGKTEIWVVNEEVWDSFVNSCPTCEDPLDVIILEEDDVDKVEVI